MKKVLARFDYRGFKILVITPYCEGLKMHSNIHSNLHLCVDRYRNMHYGILLDSSECDGEDFIYLFDRMLKYFKAEVI